MIIHLTRKKYRKHITESYIISGGYETSAILFLSVCLRIVYCESKTKENLLRFSEIENVKQVIKK